MVMMPAVMMVVMVPPMMVAIVMEAPAMVPPVMMVMTASVVVVTMVMVPATDVLQRQRAVSMLYDVIRYGGGAACAGSESIPSPSVIAVANPSPRSIFCSFQRTFGYVSGCPLGVSHGSALQRRGQRLSDEQWVNDFERSAFFCSRVHATTRRIS